MTFSIKSKVRSAEIKNAIEQSTQRAQMVLDAQVLQDSNYFCPLKTGTLQKSAIINSRIGSGLLTWRTPYARRQYYEYSKPAYQPNPNACGKWFEAAKARWLDKWVKLVNEYIQRK